MTDIRHEAECGWCYYYPHISCSLPDRGTGLSQSEASITLSDQSEAGDWRLRTVCPSTNRGLSSANLLFLSSSLAILRKLRRISQHEDSGIWPGAWQTRGRKRISDSWDSRLFSRRHAQRECLCHLKGPWFSMGRHGKPPDQVNRPPPLFSSIILSVHIKQTGLPCQQSTISTIRSGNYVECEEH